jgi:hypothetical protein
MTNSDKEWQALGEFLGAMHAKGLDGAKMRAAMLQTLGINSQPAQMPDGYVLVPVEPTLEMIDAGQDVEDLYRRGTPDTWGKVYRAMLAAAPSTKEQI